MSHIYLFIWLHCIVGNLFIWQQCSSLATIWKRRKQQFCLSGSVSIELIELATPPPPPPPPPNQVSDEDDESYSGSDGFPEPEMELPRQGGQLFLQNVTEMPFFYIKIRATNFFCKMSLWCHFFAKCHWDAFFWHQDEGDQLFFKMSPRCHFFTSRSGRPTFSKCHRDAFFLTSRSGWPTFLQNVTEMPFFYIKNQDALLLTHSFLTAKQLFPVFFYIFLCYFLIF